MAPAMLGIPVVPGTGTHVPGDDRMADVVSAKQPGSLPPAVMVVGWSTRADNIQEISHLQPVIQLGQRPDLLPVGR